MREWIAEKTLAAYGFLLPVAEIAFLAVVLILLPLAAWRRTRGTAGVGLFLASYLFGITTWLLGAGITFAAFGWFGLILGLFVLGFGLVPFGVAGAYFRIGSTELAVTIAVMAVISLGTRFLGLYLADKTDA